MNIFAHRSRALIAQVIAILLTVSFASADAKKAAAGAKTPQGTVQEIVDRMKKEGNPSVVVDYVNWDKAFSEFPEKQREQLMVKNAQDLRAFFLEMLAHPTQMMRKQMEARLGNIPAEKQEEAKQSISKIEDMMKAKEAEMKERLSSTEYKIGEVKEDGNKATVTLVQKYKDQTKQEQIPLEKEGEKWLLPSVNLIPVAQNKAAAPAPVSPPAPETEKK